MINKLDIQGIGMTSQRVRDRLADEISSMGVRSHIVLDCVRHIPRHLFIDEALANHAYDNKPLPIGFNQTISQPYIVARMTELLLSDQQSMNKVLEIGTGCGYQTAFLANISEHVYTIERIEGLLQQTRVRLQTLGYRNIRSKYEDGHVGWQKHAPYDGIIVTAALGFIPEQLMQQLAVDGRLIMPIGDHQQQSLRLIVNTREGYETQDIEAVRFVPMCRGLQGTHS